MGARPLCLLVKNPTFIDRGGIEPGGFSISEKRSIFHLEKKYDKQFKIVFQAIYQLMEEEEKPKREIEFTADKKK